MHLENKNKIISKQLEDFKDEIISLKLALNNSKAELVHERETHSEIIKRLSHDLKNPVGIIFSFIEMILEHGSNYEQEKMDKYLNVIKNSASFSIELLNNLAKYSSLLSSDISLTPEKTNYVELLKGTLRSIRKQLAEKDLSLKTNFEEEAFFLVIDGHEMVIALGNILNNAIRYSSRGSQIEVTLKVNNTHLITEIKDEGIGIDEQYHNAIFQEFFTINTYDEERQKCVGLGLCLSEKIIQHHKGEIKVNSELGKGTVFSIELPLSGLKS